MSYTGFNITWNETLSGVTVEAPCIGHNLNGEIYNCNLPFLSQRGRQNTYRIGGFQNY